MTGAWPRVVGWSECPYMLVFEGTLARSPQTPLESSRRVLGVLAPDVTLVAEAKGVTLARKGGARSYRSWYAGAETRAACRTYNPP